MHGFSWINCKYFKLTILCLESSLSTSAQSSWVGLLGSGCLNANLLMRMRANERN